MYNTAKALYTFWGSFGIPAYIEDNVPDDAVMPYLTYRLIEPVWQSFASTYVRLWYRDTSYTNISRKIDEIKNTIGEGITIPIEDGCVALTGQLTSGMSKAISVITEQYEVPLVTAGSAVTRTDGSEDYDWLFR